MQEIVQQIRDRATLEQFQDWLKQLPQDAIIGIPKDPCDCPIAKYFRVTVSLPPFPKTSISVRDFAVLLTSEGANGYERNWVFKDYCKLPKNTPRVPFWIKLVIKNVDAEEDENISVARMLEIAEEVAIALNETDSWNNH